MPALEFDQRPKELQHLAVKGVFVCGCVERGDGSRFRAQAHAHTSKDDPYCGWICFLSPKRLSQKMLCLHELAHIISGCGHNDKYRKVLREIGGRVEDQYRKRFHLRNNPPSKCPKCKRQPTKMSETHFYCPKCDYDIYFSKKTGREISPAPWFFSGKELSLGREEQI